MISGRNYYIFCNIVIYSLLFITSQVGVAQILSHPGTDTVCARARWQNTSLKTGTLNLLFESSLESDIFIWRWPVTDNWIFKVNKNELGCVCVCACAYRASLCSKHNCLGGNPQQPCCAPQCLCLGVLLRPGRLIYDQSLARSSPDGEVEGESPNASKNNRRGLTEAHLHKDTQCG